MAILAGDGLLTLAFEVMAKCEGFPAERLLKTIGALAHAAGTPRGWSPVKFWIWGSRARR